MSNGSSGLALSELLDQARTALVPTELGEASDLALMHYVVEYAPEEVSLTVRLRLRDLLVEEALRATGLLREERGEE